MMLLKKYLKQQNNKTMSVPRILCSFYAYYYSYFATYLISSDYNKFKTSRLNQISSCQLEKNQSWHYFSFFREEDIVSPENQGILVPIKTLKIELFFFLFLSGFQTSTFSIYHNFTTQLTAHEQRKRRYLLAFYSFQKISSLSTL